MPNAKSSKDINLYSNAYLEEICVDKRLYEEFCEKFRKTTNFDESKTNDLIHFAYGMLTEMQISMTKTTLLSKIADLVDVIQPDELMDLKHYEFKRLLYASKDNYQAIFNESIMLDIVPKDTKTYVSVDPE